MLSMPKQDEQQKSQFTVEHEDGHDTSLTFNVNAFKANVQTVSTLPNAVKLILRKNPWERSAADLAYVFSFIDKLKCFERYSSTVRQELSCVLHYESFEDGRVIVRQGHPGLSFYFILSGTVIVEVTEEDKRTGERNTHVIGENTAGSSFGELSLLHGSRRTATISCKVDTEFLRLDKPDFDLVLRRSYQQEWDTRMSALRSLAAFGHWSEEELSATNDRAKLEEFPPNTFTDKVCRTDVTYPPPSADSNPTVPTFVLNLDLDPEERWKPLMKNKSAELKAMINDVLDLIGYFIKNDSKLISIIDDILGPLVFTFPQPYQGELVGISVSSGLPLGHIVLYNIFYEVFTVCTSIVAESPNGTLFHSRNLDFGLFLGWDIKTEKWALTEKLRPLIVNVDYQRKGKTIAKAVHFAGYIGVLTGIKPGILTLTMNERMNIDGGFLGILEGFLGQRSEQWMGFFLRDTLVGAIDYNSTKNRVVNAKLLSPGYIILGGNKTGEGAIIVLDRKEKAYVEELDPKNGKWFLVQTNYDPVEKPPFFDDRRTPATKCMTNTTQKALDYSSVYNVLSTKPVLNLLTTYTALMQVNTGYMETYIRDCPQPCFPW